MGFFFAHVMSFYSMGYREVLALPVRVFWHLVDQIPRIEAYRNRRQLSIAACAQSKDGVEQLNQAFENELGEVTVGSQETAKGVHPNEIPIPSKEEQERAFNVLASLM